MAKYERVDRQSEARKLLARRSEWIVAKIGGKVVGAYIPSRSVPNKYHGVALDGFTCDCADMTFRKVRCAHSLALEMAAQQRRQHRQRRAAP